MRKIPFAGNELTSQRVRGLRGTSELPGRPAGGRLNRQFIRMFHDGMRARVQLDNGDFSAWFNVC